MCLHIFVGSFSVGLRLAKTTGTCAKEGLCLSLLRSSLLPNLSAVATPLAHRELHERHGKTVRCATAFLYRSLASSLFVLRPLAIAFRFAPKPPCMCLPPISGESFSVGLLRAKTTEARAKKGLCLSLLRSSLPLAPLPAFRSLAVAPTSCLPRAL